MIKELIAMANDLDSKGFSKKADAMDKIVSKAMEEWDDDDFDDDPDWDSEEGREGALVAIRAELKEKELALQAAIDGMNVSAPGEFGVLLHMVTEIEDLKRREEEQSGEVYRDAYDRMSDGEQREHDHNNAQQEKYEMFRNEY